MIDKTCKRYLNLEPAPIANKIDLESRPKVVQNKADNYIKIRFLFIRFLFTYAYVNIYVPFFPFVYIFPIDKQLTSAAPTMLESISGSSRSRSNTAT